MQLKKSHKAMMKSACGERSLRSHLEMVCIGMLICRASSAILIPRSLRNSIMRSATMFDMTYYSPNGDFSFDNPQT